MIRLEILEARHRNTYISWMSFGSKEIKLLPYNTHHGFPMLPRENYGSLELKTQRVSNGWTLGSLNLRRDSRASQEQWLLFCLFTPRGGVMNHVVQETMSFLDIFLPLCVALLEQLSSILYSNVVPRVFSWWKYDVIVLPHRWSSKSFQKASHRIISTIEFEERDWAIFELWKFRFVKTFSREKEKGYVTFFCSVSFVFFVTILKVFFEDI